MNPVDGPGAVAPGFELPLLGGGRASLADLVARGGAMVFFKSDCATSRLVVPELAGLARALAAEGRAFLAVAQESEPEATAFREEHRLEYPFAAEAPPYHASRAFAVEIVPTLVVVDAAGRLAARLEGFVKSEYLELSPALKRELLLREAPPVLDHPETLPAIKPG